MSLFTREVAVGEDNFVTCATKRSHFFTVHCPLATVHCSFLSLVHFHHKRFACKFLHGVAFQFLV